MCFHTHTKLTYYKRGVWLGLPLPCGKFAIGRSFPPIPHVIPPPQSEVAQSRFRFTTSLVCENVHPVIAPQFRNSLPTNFTKTQASSEGDLRFCLKRDLADTDKRFYIVCSKMFSFLFYIYHFIF